MNPLLAAWGLFTVVPTRPLDCVDRRTARGAILALPWVGLALGCGAATLAAVVDWVSGGRLLAAIVALAVVAAATGALHLDGVADTADGLGSRRPPEQALAIMKRSDIGPMGVATLVLVLLLDAGALGAPRLSTAAFACAVAAFPAVGRIAATAATGRWVPSARPGGFGALFAGVTSPAGLAVDAVAVLVVVAGLGALGSGWAGALVFAVAAVGAWLVGAAWQRHLIRRLGGLTGDTFGSLIEVTQLTFVLVTACLTR